MASKNIDECIMLAMSTGPASDFKKTLTNELRDFLAHEIMRLENEDRDHAPTAVQLFKKVFGEDG